MSTDTPSPNPAGPTDSATSNRRHRSRRVRAMLAGGTVLGLGAAATLAAWSDNEFAFGQFNAGTFNVQGSQATAAANHSWSDHFTANGAALTFSTGYNAMQPGNTYYAPFSVRVDPSKNSYAASVVIQDATGTGNDALEGKTTWGAKIVANPESCTASGYSGSSTVVRADGNAMDYTGPSSSFSLAKDSTPVTVCLAVKLAAQTASDDPNSAAWNFGSATLTEVWHLVATAV